MQYRKFGRLNWESSLLGFGTMRLPVLDGDQSKIDEEEAQRMIYYAIDQGVNYIDTAYPYHQGKSEVFLGKILKGKYRERVKLATKLPIWLLEKKEDCERYFNEQLERLQSERVDFYLFHGLSKANWGKVLELDCFAWAERKMAEGKIGSLGFSFHDEFALFKEIVDFYDNWTFCQIQYNYFDEDYQAGKRGLKYAFQKGLAVVVMEPIRGGSLAKAPSPVQKIWDQAKVKRTPAEWALLWVFNHPEVSVTLSGMSTFEQVSENIAIASKAKPGTFTENDLELIAQARETYRNLRPVPCTQCNYCQPCPAEIPIPDIFEIYNDGKCFEQMERAKMAYKKWIKDEHKADRCTECGQCESLCPQQIPIREWLKRIHEELSSDISH